MVEVNAWDLECYDYQGLCAASLQSDVEAFLIKLADCMVTQPDGWEDGEMLAMIRALRVKVGLDDAR